MTSVGVGEPVGDFYFHLVRLDEASVSGSVVKVDREMTSSTKILSFSNKPTVIHFYNGGWGGCRPCAAQMEKWARSGMYYDRVQFLCVCVESQGVAKDFSRMFQLKHAINCWIPSREYFPVGFGQLGCSGFIVVDPKGNFVSRKTRAFLDYGESAFAHVDQLLAPLLKNQAQQEKEQQQHASKTNAPPRTLTVDRDDPNPQPQQQGPVPPAASPSSVAAETLASGIPSVGVESMDREHEQCLTLLKELVTTPTTVILEKVLEELERHFAHEEALMKEHGFGGGSGDFSALTSHTQDHQRILDMAHRELERQKAASMVATSCVVGSS